ncbi:hypothetical protein ACJDU8_22130 [Clostridium sp. WILCCON 0269]|uniref:J domain-containing protein n=1 Tax=Candidatus Clostridium eludens TaxID=3381663 RepID=A0ABW8SQC0_9CLOT
MYCVIQKVFNKKENTNGEYKELKVESSTLSVDGKAYTKYYYRHTGEQFKRPHREAFKISIHESYRENGKVKKKQWVICTVGYYDITDGWSYIGDHVIGGLGRKAEELGITEEQICDMVYKKFDPIIATVEKEFKLTEEYKAKKQHDKILEKYRKAKEKFEKKYGDNTYDYCYDVFGVLRNEDYLKELQGNYKAQQEYYKSSYYGSGSSNYSSYDYSSYLGNKHSNYTEDEKVKLKKIYKVLALKFHPDMKEGDAGMMKLINTLKESWGI